MSRLRWYSAVAPGILVAATGVGAGDLLTASLGGSVVGLAILWAAGLGAVLKWFLNEGIARWQMATGTTVLEGWVMRLGRWIQWVFLVYLLVWSLVTGGALVNACGVAGTGLWPVAANVHISKIIWGVVHSLLGFGLVWIGGFRVFERLMSVCIGLMFVSVITTVACIGPDWGLVLRGLTVPTIPENGLGWVLGILGGVGGTVTLLSYGYWIREKGRSGESGARACRIDLALGYAMTAVFGVCMITIGSRVEIQKGPLLALELADKISEIIGRFGFLAKGVFLVGFWGAVFSSLLGVWQSVPYLFADFMSLRRGVAAAQRAKIDFTRTAPYRVYLAAMTLAPLPLLWVSVRQAQLTYAILGSFFMPLMALTLLIMNNRTDWVGPRFRNGLLTNAALIVTLLLFAYVGVDKTVESFQALLGR